MRRIKLGLGEWGFRDLPLEEHFIIARDFGFHTMEFGFGGDRIGRLPTTVTARELAEFRALRERYGISTPFCCLENDFTLPDAAAHRDMVKRTLNSMRDAAAFGAEKVRLFAGFTPLPEMTGEIRRRMLDAFEQAAATARELGLAVSIETHGRIKSHDGVVRHLPTVSTDGAWLSRLPAELPPEIGFNYDPGNLKAADPEDRDYRLALLNPRINYCHLKDWIPCRGGWIAGAPGDDDLDYAKLIPRMSYDGVFLIEYEPTADLADGIRRSIAYLRRHFELEFA